MRVLLAAWGSMGEHVPVAGLCRRLQSSGFDVRVIASEAHRGLYPVNEDHFVPLRSIHLGDHAHRSFNVTGEVVRHLLDGMVEEQLAITTSAIAEHRIDTVLSSWITPGVITAAEAAGRRLVPLHLYPLSMLHANDFPVLTRWPRLTARMGYPRDATTLRDSVVAFYRRASPRLLALRARFGLLDDGAIMPGLGRPGLALFPSQLMRAPTPHVFFSPSPPPAQAPLPPSVEDFLSHGPPPWLCFMGSMGRLEKARSRELLKRLVSPGRRFIHVIGSRSADVSSTDSMLELDAWPIDQLLPHVRGLIHHGGVNTIASCMAAGRPSLIIPRSGDQFDNACRLADLGISLVMPQRDLGGERVSALFDSLQAPVFVAAAQKISKGLHFAPATSLPDEARQLIWPVA